MSIKSKTPEGNSTVKTFLNNWLYKHVNKYMYSMGMVAYAADPSDDAVDVKQMVKDAVEAATAPLIAKRDELLGEVKKLRKNQEITPEVLEAVEAERDELKANLQKANGELKTAKKAAEDATKALEAEVNLTNTEKVKSDLTAAFLNAGVSDSDYLDLLVSKYSSSAKVVKDGEARKVTINDKDIDTYMTEWKSTDSAKKVISPNQNNGGGSQGNTNTTTNSKTMTRSAFDQLSPADKATFSSEKGTLTDG